MFAARTFGRFASRATPLVRLSVRSISTRTPRLANFVTPKLCIPSFRGVSRFSTSMGRFADEGSVDTELIAKLDAELELEKEMKGFEEMPESVKSFLESGTFKLNDNPGHEEVELVRKFGDETIRIEFSISDLNLMNNELDDGAIYEDESTDAPEATQSGSKSGKDSRTSTEQDEDEEYMEEDNVPEPSFPAHLSISIEKPIGGALKISGLAQDGMIILQNVIYHPNPKLLKFKSAENDYQSEGLYAGPEFANLDEDLQVLFERYLDERGINTALALFVPDYIEYKEQKEYLRWLENVKKFIAV
ncbi:mitochondrial glyco protein [Terfezia boudieri ATCC MYA-4762]|uniref:Mitochondrial glyco protein n=1 Tax=Terfezia boudieri ATCC MYA-4762 TaxID=1051890 RepID=A0A3N4L738_9PEZI|nr:mitochondrial glyco protein [Terfezia boudieri ATCC MYA-4762]